MANVQHIFTSDADPIGVAPLGSHHINSLSGDIWLYGDEWSLIYRGGTAGNIAVIEGEGVPLDTPAYPCIHLDTADKRAFIAVSSSMDGYSWEEIQFVEGLP